MIRSTSKESQPPRKTPEVFSHQNFRNPGSQLITMLKNGGNSCWMMIILSIKHGETRQPHQPSWMSRRKLGSITQDQWVIYRTNILTIYKYRWNNPLILTIDQKFRRDIQVKHGGLLDFQGKGSFFSCRRQDDGKPRKVPCESLRIAYEVGYGKFEVGWGWWEHEM